MGCFSVRRQAEKQGGGYARPDWAFIDCLLVLLESGNVLDGKSGSGHCRHLGFRWSDHGVILRAWRVAPSPSSGGVYSLERKKERKKQKGR